MTRPDPAHVVKHRRDALLQSLVAGVPYIQFLGISFERHGDELTAVLPYNDRNVGNPMIPALHGGVTAAFLEVTAIIGLSWAKSWDDMEAGKITDDSPRTQMPKTIDFSVDYLRAGMARDAYARARINRSGRRYASVHVEAWQDNRTRMFAQATGHFLMPASSD